MTRQNLIFMGLALLLLTVGCAHQTVINVDGMPISNHEYTATNPETKIRVSYVLCRYYKKAYGKEYMIVPEFLDAWENQVIDRSKTERLVLHIKVINLKLVKYNMWYELALKDGVSNKNLYSGRLPRKDFSINLPLDPKNVKYRASLVIPGGEEVHEIGFPFFSYSTKGTKGGAPDNTLK